ncbi:nicotinamide N-methyltransferase-like [Pseudophryne corroboree]|uniref:nicotinamide N-methyltransferase-like n=1 Tax=Pseudophryne corroboree TaxID=495146 RepID=UPI003081B9CB
MASSALKHYHDKDFEAKEFVETHFSHGEIGIIEDSMGQPVKILHELFSSDSSLTCYCYKKEIIETDLSRGFKILTMASSSLKHYHDKDFKAKEFVETHFSHGEIGIIEDSMVQPVKILHELFSSGQVKGEILLDVSAGAILYQLLSASNVFKEIYVMDFTDANIKHFKQWLEKGEDATDWSFASKRVCELQGNRDGWQEQEEKVRRAIKNVMKWDIFENSCIDPQLVPMADCVISLLILNIISKTKEDFQKNVKSFTSRLKIGGHLLLFTVLDMTYYRVGQHKHFILTVDEAFVREAVINTGFVIEKADLWCNRVESYFADYKHKFFILARKEREV